MKDFNDVLLAGIQVSSILLEPIDIYCAKQLLKQYPDDQPQQYKVMDKYVKTVKSELVKSDLIVMLAKQWGKDIDVVKKQFSVQLDNSEEKLQKLADIYDCFNALDEAMANDVEGQELSIGVPGIDENITFRKKRVIILGAFSNSGKTEWLIEWILHWILVLRKRVLFFSLEMPKEDILEIVIAKIMKIPQYKVRTYIRNNPDTYRKIAEVIQQYLLVYDDNDLDINGIEENIILANQNKFDGKLDIVATDYYQYLQGIKTLDDDKITARRMKAVAKKHNVMFVMLSQFNKNSQRKGKDDIPHPTMVDLNGAGDIGASGDVIALLWRPIYYQKMSEIDEEKYKYESRVFIPKARGGFKKGKQYFTLEYNVDTSRLLQKA